MVQNAGTVQGAADERPQLEIGDAFFRYRMDFRFMVTGLADQSNAFP
jgi:hypothetical protein